MKKQKKFLSLLMICSLLCSSIPLQNEKTASAAIATYQVAVGKKIQIFMVLKGKRITSKVKYTSKNKKIAKVSKKGIVTGVKKGTTKIVMKYKKTKIVCKIKVTKNSSQTTNKTTIQSKLSKYKKWWSNGNSYSVQQGSPMYPFFTLGKSFKLQAISTYHWNNGQGATPGKIALMKFNPEDANADGTFDTKKGKIIGPWQAAGMDNNRYWVVFPNVTLSTGYYCIIDLGPSTWSYNSSSKNEGFADVYGTEAGETTAITTPKPTTAAVNTPKPTATTVKTPSPTVTAAKTPAPTATPKTATTSESTPLPTLSPAEDNTETPTEHTSQSDGTVPTPTEAPIGKKADIGVKTSVSYTSGDVSSGAKKTASVTVKKPTARLGDISVDYGELNLEEDQTVKMTLSTLSEKTDKKNGYSVKAWNLDTGSSEEYVLPVIVTIPYDSSVTDPYQELNVETYNSTTGAWEDAAFEIDESSRTVTAYLLRDTTFALFKELVTEKGAVKNAADQAKLLLGRKSAAKPTAEEMKTLKLTLKYKKFYQQVKKGFPDDVLNEIVNGKLPSLDRYPSHWFWNVGTFTNLAGMAVSGLTILRLWVPAQKAMDVVSSALSKDNLEGAGAVLTTLSTNFMLSDYVIGLLNGKTTVKEIFTKRWPEIYAQAVAHMGDYANLVDNKTILAVSLVGTVGTFAWVAPTLSIAAGCCSLVNSYFECQIYNNVQDGGSEGIKLAKELARRTYYSKKSERLWMYLDSGDVDSLKKLSEDECREKGFSKETVTRLLSQNSPDKYKKNYIRMKTGFTGKGYYASDLGKLLNFIMKKYPENPDKWLPKFNAAIEGQSRWLRKFNQEELNALYYAFTGEASEVGYRYAEQNIGEEQILYELKNTVKQSRLFLNFADKCREQLDRVDQENWRIYQRQMNRKLLFKLQDQDGKEVAFKDLGAYKDKYIFLEMEDGTWTIWQPKTKSSDQKGSTTSTIAESTYFGFTQLGGKVKTGTSDGINELSVYESLEDYTKNKKLETITFTGPGETSPSGSSEEETVIIKLDAMSLNKSELTLNVNETFQLQLNGADASKVTWSMDDTAAGVADVSKTGLVTAKKTGKVKVIAQYNGKKFICVVEVQTKREFKGTYKGTLTRGEKTYSCTVTVSDNPNYDGSYLAMISAEGLGHVRDADMTLDTSGENIVYDSTFRTFSQHFKCDGKTFTFEYSDPDHIYSSTFTTQSAYCTK